MRVEGGQVMDAAGKAFLEEAERVLLDPVVGGSGWQATYIRKRKILMNHAKLIKHFPEAPCTIPPFPRKI